MLDDRIAIRGLPLYSMKRVIWYHMSVKITFAVCNCHNSIFLDNLHYTLHGNITNCTCFIGNRYNYNKIQVVTENIFYKILSTY